MIGPGIIVPLVILAVLVPTIYVLARRRLRSATTNESRGPRAVPLTSAALHRFASSPWRVVHEVSEERLGGVEHVVTGPPGIYALVSVLEPLPSDGAIDDPMELGRLAVMRGEVEDLLTPVALSCAGVVIVHWGRSAPDGPVEVARAPGVLAVDGHRLEDWLGARRHDAHLSPTQVDLAWRTITTGIGRPDPVSDR